MTSPSLGTFARLAIAPPGTPVPQFVDALEFSAESLRREQTLLDTAGLRGTRAHPLDRTRTGTSLVQGEVRLPVSPQVLTLLWPRILGGSPVEGQFPLAESLPACDLLLDRVARRFVYRGCRVDRAVLRGRAGGLLELVIEWIGATEELLTTPAPNLAPPVDPPLVFHDSTLTLRQLDRPCLEFELVIDNHLAVRFANSDTPADISPLDRTVQLSAVLPFTPEVVDLYGLGAAGIGAGLLRFTNGPQTVAIQLPAIQWTDRSPVVPGRQEITLPLTGFARRTATQPELLVQHTTTS